MLALLFGFVLAVGTVLVVLGLFERQQEAAELRNRNERLARAAVVRPFTGLGDVPAAESEKEFARSEEARARAQRRAVRRTTLLPSLSRFSRDDNYIGRLEDELIQVRSPWRATELIAASVLLALLVLVLCLLLGFWLFSFPIAASVLLLPRFYVKAERNLFYRRFDEQLSDALMLMSNSLRAGFSFLQSMEMVAREAPSPISDEFARVTQQITVGVSVEDALNAMGARVKSVDLQLVIVAVIVQREIGGALAQLLEIIAAVIRERQRIRGEIRTLTTQGRLTGAILGLLPVIVAALIWLVGRMVAPTQPSFIDPLISTSLGHMLLAGAVIWQLIGIWIIMRIVNIKV